MRNVFAVCWRRGPMSPQFHPSQNSYVTHSPVLSFCQSLVALSHIHPQSNEARALLNGHAEALRSALNAHLIPDLAALTLAYLIPTLVKES